MKNDYSGFMAAATRIALDLYIFIKEERVQFSSAAELH
jgi:hypothetical protein